MDISDNILNLKINIPIVIEILKYHQKDGKTMIPIRNMVGMASIGIRDMPEKYEVLKKYANVRDEWNISELALKLDISRQTLYNWIKNGHVSVTDNKKISLKRTILLWDKILNNY